MKWTVYIFLLFTCYSCASDFETIGLSEYKELKAEFTATELTDLQLILDYYSSVICQPEVKSKNEIVHCFMDHLDAMKRNQKNTGDIKLAVSASEQLGLYKRLQPSTMESIWNIPKKNRADLPEKYTMFVRTDGIYTKLSKLLQADYPPFGTITESTIAAGGISPTTFANLLNKHTEYNFFDDRVRLFFTLHYLAINDQNKRLLGGIE